MHTDSINHAGGLPPYLQVAGILRERIDSGELTGRIPSERTLAQQFGVAVSTIRKAIKVLREEGAVQTHQGWGTRVIPPKERPHGP